MIKTCNKCPKCPVLIQIWIMAYQSWYVKDLFFKYPYPSDQFLLQFGNVIFQIFIDDLIRQFQVLLILIPYLLSSFLHTYSMVYEFIFHLILIFFQLIFIFFQVLLYFSNVTLIKTTLWSQNWINKFFIRFKLLFELNHSFHVSNFHVMHYWFAFVIKKLHCLILILNMLLNTLSWAHYTSRNIKPSIIIDLFFQWYHRLLQFILYFIWWKLAFWIHHLKNVYSNL